MKRLQGSDRNIQNLREETPPNKINYQKLHFQPLRVVGGQL
jgi:hypothetical protein